MTDLRITATDASTVFTGAADVHRFDAPSSREIANTIRTVLGPNPDGAHVHITADDTRLRELEYALADYDIDLTTELLGPDPADVPRSLNAPSAPPAPWDPPRDPPTDTFAAIADNRSSNIGVWIIAAVVAVVAVVCAVVIYYVVWGGSAGSAGSADRAEGTASSVETPTATEAAAGATPSVAVESSIREEAPQTVLLEQDGLQVELPAGFALEADDGTWRATGDDPNFRLHIAVERLYQLPAKTMAEQLLADVEADPQTELVDTDGTSVTYLERAADGSQALWKTWPHGTTQLFVGCHTRHEPTTVQRATCRMAMETAEFKGADMRT